MRKFNLAFVLVSLVFCTKSFGQEAFKKVYYTPNTFYYGDGSTILLKKTSKIKYKDFSEKEQDSLRKLFPKLGSIITYAVEKDVSGEKVNLTVTDTVNETFYQKQVFSKKENVVRCGIKGFVKFEKNKLIVNPYLIKDKNGKFGKRGAYEYQLDNRQTIKLKFTEWTVSALAMPIKYRFKDKDAGISEEFSTAFNVNLFIGRTFYGKSSFFHRKDVDNITNTYKLTGGLLLGASTVTLNANNTSTSDIPINPEVVKGLATVGLGITFSYNKINLGAFLGWDYSIGDDAEKWNYNKKLWLGFALGYSLFNF